MVKRSLRKSAVREIFRSPGRYLAILGIIMLGAGFFVGLRVTRDAMILTADGYLDRTRFFDYQLISTLQPRKALFSRMLWSPLRRMIFRYVFSLCPRPSTCPS